MHSQYRRAIFCIFAAACFASPVLAQSTAPVPIADSRPGATDAKATTPATSTPLSVVVTVPPLKGLVEPLLPPGSTITMLVRPGRSEHGYEFTADDIASLARADLVVLVGLGLEPRIEQSLDRHKQTSKPQPTTRVVINWGTVADLTQTGEDDHDHEHGATCTHGHGWVDQHLWLDPSLVKQLIPKLKDAVLQAQRSKLPVGATIDPQEVQRLDAAEAQLTLLVTAIDLEYRSALDPFKGRAIVCHHDAYSRLADRYGLKVAAAIKTTTAGEPTPSELASVVKAIKEHKAQAVFIEPQFDPSIAQRVAAAAGVRIAHLDPLGQGDWAATMRSNLQSLTQNLGQAK